MASGKKNEPPGSRPNELLPGLFVLGPRGASSRKRIPSSPADAGIFAVYLPGKDGFSYVEFLVAPGMTMAGARNDNGEYPD